MENTIDVSEETFLREFLSFVRDIGPKENGFKFYSHAPLVEYIGRELYKTENPQDWNAEIFELGEYDFIQKRVIFTVQIDMLVTIDDANKREEFVLEFCFKAGGRIVIEINTQSLLDIEEERIIAAINEKIGQDIKDHEEGKVDPDHAERWIRQLQELRNDPLFVYRTLFPLRD